MAITIIYPFHDLTISDSQGGGRESRGCQSKAGKGGGNTVEAERSHKNGEEERLSKWRFQSQLGWTWNHLGDTPLHVPLRG